MNLYAFELGRKKKLSTAELTSVLGRNKLVEENLDTCVFKLSDQDFDKLQDRLGGTIKIIHILDQLPLNSGPDIIKKSIEKIIRDTFSHNSGKVPFSVSHLSFINRREINIKDLLIFSKKILKSLGLNSRFVNKDFKNTKPSTIYKAKVIEKGIDICIIKGKSELLIGETISMQNIDAYSRRDFHKPVRDAKIGMLPPKLAQIMINLATPEAKTIYDPFCGTGTVLTEALLMGKSVIGSDINPRMVEASEKNCAWLKEAFKVDQSSPHSSWRVFEKNVTALSKTDLPEKIDAVVTEGYLGEAVSHLPKTEDRAKTFRELSTLHHTWLTKIHAFTPQSCRVVLCIPAYRDGKRLHHLEKFEEIGQSAGYKVIEVFTYDRPDQIVARDIKVLEKR